MLITSAKFSQTVACNRSLRGDRQLVLVTKATVDFKQGLPGGVAGILISEYKHYSTASARLRDKVHIDASLKMAFWGESGSITLER